MDTYNIDTAIPSNSNNRVERTKVHPNDAHLGGVWWPSGNDEGGFGRRYVACWEGKVVSIDKVQSSLR